MAEPHSRPERPGSSMLDPDWQRFRPQHAPILTVEPFGRASTIFFQGLLEGHPNLLVLPWDATPLFNKRGSERDEAGIARHLDGLVDNAVREYGPPGLALDRSAFRSTAEALLHELGIDWGTEILATFLGYAAACHRPLAEIRYLCVAAHGHPRLSYVLGRFPHWRAVFLARDPRASFASMKKRMDLDLLAQQANFSAFHRVLYRGLLRSHPDRVLSIRHEDLHVDWKHERTRFLAFTGLDDHPSLLRSSYFGWPYTGEGRHYGSTAELFESEPDPRYVTEVWKETLSPHELRAVQESSAALMTEFGYPIASETDLKGRPRPANYLALFVRRSRPALKRPVETIGSWSLVRTLSARWILPHKLRSIEVERTQLFERVLEEFPNPSDQHAIPGFQPARPSPRARFRRLRKSVLAGSALPLAATLAAALWAAGAHSSSDTSVAERAAAASGMAFLLAFASRPLRKLWRNSLTGWIRKHRRQIGIACGLLLGLHVCALLAQPESRGEAGALAWALLAAASGFIAAMTATSSNRAATLLGAGSWKRLHRSGTYLACVAATLAWSPFSQAPWGPRPLYLVGLVSVVALRASLALKARRTGKPRGC